MPTLAAVPRSSINSAANSGTAAQPRTGPRNEYTNRYDHRSPRVNGRATPGSTETCSNNFFFLKKREQRRESIGTSACFRPVKRYLWCLRRRRHTRKQLIITFAMTQTRRIKREHAIEDGPFLAILDPGVRGFDARSCRCGGSNCFRAPLRDIDGKHFEAPRTSLWFRGLPEPLRQ